jgi:hypothetical protein
VSITPIRHRQAASKDLLKKLRRHARGALPDTCVTLERTAREGKGTFSAGALIAIPQCRAAITKKASGRYSSRDLFAT